MARHAGAGGNAGGEEGRREGRSGAPACVVWRTVGTTRYRHVQPLPVAGQHKQGPERDTRSLVAEQGKHATHLETVDAHQRFDHKYLSAQHSSQVVCVRACGVYD